MKLVKKKILNLLIFLKDRMALMALCMIPAFGWGYFVKHNSIIFCLLISFAGYIMIDIVATGYQKYISVEVKSESKPPPKVKEIPVKPPEMKITDDDMGEIDPDYFDKFMDRTKSLPKQTGSVLVDIGETISSDGDIIIDNEEIYDNLGVKF